MKKFLYKKIGIRKKIKQGGEIKIYGTLLKVNKNKILLKIDKLPYPEIFNIGKNQWLPFYISNN